MSRAAARKLRALPDDGRPFRVVVPKSSGREVVFMRYELAADAKRAALLLRWAGSAALVIGPQGELDLSEAAT